MFHSLCLRVVLLAGLCVVLCVSASLLYLCVIALGYIAAGSIATLFSWRVVFLAEALLMAPFPIVCFFLPEVSLIVANSLHRLAPADRVVKEEQMRIRYGFLIVERRIEF